MIDIEHEVREALRRHELEVPLADPIDAPVVVRRTRTRQVANAFGAVLVAALVVLGLTSGVSALLRSAPRQADEPPPTPATRHYAATER